MTALEKLVYSKSYTQEAPEAGETPAAHCDPETGKMPVLQLTVTERAALLESESIIRKWRKEFVYVGEALARIRDSRLYREKYSTFEDYCLQEWEISDRFARNLRSAADVVRLLRDKQFAALPASESQARPLTKLPREEWAPAWEEVLADGHRVTASRVAEVVQRRVDRLTGIRRKSDTDILVKPAAPIDAGTREERILAAAASAQAKLRELQDLIRTADSASTANISQAIRSMDELRDHFARVEEMQSNRKAAA